MENVVLINCPFCGGQPTFEMGDRVFHGEGSVRCPKCEIVVLAGFDDEKTGESVDMKWNRRVLLEFKVANGGFLDVPELRAVIQAYTAEVNRRADNRKSLSGKNVGPHLSAMQEINKELGI